MENGACVSPSEGTGNSTEFVRPRHAAAPGLLRVGEGIRDELVAHVRQALPHEGVGLLAVSAASVLDRSIDAVRFYPGTNVAASASRFTMDPAEVIVAFREIDELGWRLGAIVHSHPHGPAVPSPTDLREARYPDALMVIVSMAGVVPDIRAWWIGSRGDELAPVRVPIAVD